MGCSVIFEGGQMMQDNGKTRDQLIQELLNFGQRVVSWKIRTVGHFQKYLIKRKRPLRNKLFPSWMKRPLPGTGGRCRPAARNLEEALGIDWNLSG